MARNAGELNETVASIGGNARAFPADVTASGKADALSGLYLTPFDDLDAILKNIAVVEAEKLHSLRVRPLGGSAATSAIAAIRDAAQRGTPSP